jgi:hypothetical protein
MNARNSYTVIIALCIGTAAVGIFNILGDPSDWLDEIIKIVNSFTIGVLALTLRAKA